MTLNKQTAKPVRCPERGNIFFTLFGAVAVVGILGAGIMATMRGPLSTMVEVNRRTQAESEMSIAAKLVLLEAVESLAHGGDCDSDSFVEPLEYKDAGAGDKPVGGGYLPDSIGSKKQDPWGNNYGYCSWDAGPVTDDSACDDNTSGGNERLSGTGGPEETYTVIAVVSAGPDGIFQTTCTGGATPGVTKAANSDDIINSFDYKAASAATDGLWKIKSGDADTAEIGKNIEAQGAKFTEAVDLTSSATAQLKLGAASMLYPTQIELAVCNPANNLLIRVNTTTNPPNLELCDGANSAWASVSAGALTPSLWQKNPGDLTEIYYNTDNVGIGLIDPAQALDVVGSIQLSENLMMANAKSILWASGASVTEGTGALEINANGGGGVELDVGADAVHIAANTIITGTTADNTTDALTVEDNDGADILVVQDDGMVGIGDASPNDPLDVAGSIDSTQSYKIDGNSVLRSDSTMADTILLGNDAGAGVTGDLNTILGGGAAATLTTGAGNILIGSSADVPAATTTNYLNLGNVIHADLANKRVGIGFADTYDVSTFNDALEVSGNIDSTGSINATGNIDAGGDVTGAVLRANSQIFVDGDKLGPPSDCDSDEKLQWTDGAGWSCVTDQNDGSGGGGSIGDGLFEINAGIVRTKNAGAPWASSDFVFGSPQLDDDGDTAHYNRVLFDKSKGAFRAGHAALGNWDDAERGDNSAAFGNNSRATASESMAWGAGNLASGQYGTAFGATSIASGLGSTAFGNDTRSTALVSTAWGWKSEATGGYSTAWGWETKADGFWSTALGRDAWTGDGTGTLGDYSVAIGFGDMTGNPKVTGNGSFGLFMGDQHNTTISTANIMALLGGKMLIDPAAPAAVTAPSTGGDQDLELDVEGDIGAINYCDKDGNNCFQAADVGAASDSLFEINGTVVRTIDASAPWATSDFVFGSPQLDDDANFTHQSRMFFDKSKGAFRAGTADAAQWDDGSLGNESFAVGKNTTASGLQSFAAGHSTTASSSASTALGQGTAASGLFSLATGVNSQASGSYSTAMAYESIASGDASTAIGLRSQASGFASMAFGADAVAGNGVAGSGLGDYSVTFGLGISGSSPNPRVTGDSSFAIFMGDQQGKDLQANNTLALVGGTMVIDATSAHPAASTGGDQDLELDVEGDIGAVNYCDENGDNCFTATDVSAGSSALSSITAATTDATIASGANNIAWNWQLAAAETGLAFGETAASTGGANNQYIVSASTLAASTAMPLYLKNLGAGRSFQVDDSAGDTTPFIIDSTGNVGAGTVSPSEKIQVDNGNIYVNGENSGFIVDSYSYKRIGLIKYSGREGGIWRAKDQDFEIGRTDVTELPGAPSVFTTDLYIGDHGAIGIGTTSPSTGGEQALELDVEGDVGAVNYCDKDGNNCFTAADVGGGANAIDDLTDAETDYVTDHNLFMGSTAGAAIAAGGQYNLFVGEGAGAAVSTSDQNTALGYQSLAGSTSSSNTGIGYRALAGTGPNWAGGNTALGNEALLGNSDGYSNTGVGNGALYSNQSGFQNTALGAEALTLQEGSKSTAVGYKSLRNSTGNGNTALGYQAGDNITTGINNIIIGNDIDASSPTGNNQLNIGNILFGDLDIGGDPKIGAYKYCDESLANCFTATDVTGGGGTTVALSSITAATSNATIASGANNIVWNWQLTAAEAGFIFGETAASTGGSNNQYVLEAATLATSTAMPLYVKNLGAGRSFQVDDEAGDATPFVIDASGNVGIGTANPTNTLNVAGGVSIQGSTSFSPPGAVVDVYITNAAMFSGDDIGLYESGGDGAIAVYDPTDALYRYGGGLLSITPNSSIGIGTTTPSTGGEQNLMLDVEGAIGAVAYCNKNGNNCFDPSTLNSLSSLFEISGGAVRTVDSLVPWATSDFVIGSSQLADTGNAANDNRMFFDKSKGAFRAGTADSTQWDDSNVGISSVALGNKTIASGTASTALGNTTIASGIDSTAMGISTTASGFASTATGYEAIAGNGVAASGFGDYSMAIGLGDSSTATFPRVTGSGSLGIFMGDQSSVNISASNIMALLGGRLVIDPDTTSATNTNVSSGAQQLELDVEGDIGATNYCDKDGNNCFTASSVGSGTPALSSISAATTNATIGSGANNIFWNWQLTGAETGLLFGETAASTGGASNQYILEAATKASSTAIPLYVQNLGNALSFEVDDGDATPFVIDASGNLGVGTSAPEALLEIQGIEATDATLALDADDGDDATDTWFLKSLAAGNSLSFMNDTTEVMGLSSGGNLQIDGDLTISGDDLFMATNTSGDILVADGTNYNPVAVSGDVTISSAGATTIGADKITEAKLKVVDTPADEECLTYESTGGDFEWQSCDNGTALSAITAATGGATIANAANNIIWNWKLTASGAGMKFGETTASTGGSSNQYILQAATLASSTAIPMYVQNLGAGLSFQVDDVASDATPFVVDASGNVGIGTAAPGSALQVVGDIQYSGILTDTSDKRLKTDIQRLNKNDLIERLGKIDTYSFRMKDDEKKRLELGVIAQEVEKVFPELVSTADNEMHTKSVNYIGFIAPLIEASKDLKAQNDVLKAELAAVKSDQALMDNRVSDLTRQVQLLNNAAGQNTNKASLTPWMGLLMLLVLGMGIGGSYILIAGRKTF